MKKMFILDRNIVSLIKDSVNKKPQNQKDKIRMLKKLRSIDRKNSIITPILSIREGQTGKSEIVDEKINTLQKESDYIQKFYKTAQVDTRSLQKNAFDLANVFSNHKEDYWNSLELFFDEVCPVLSQPISDKKKQSVLNSLIESADKHQVKKGTPVFICSVAVLFGSKCARKVLKPKKNKADHYNALSDILLITRINFIKLVSYQSGLKARYEFLTMDKALKEFMSFVNTDKLSSTGQIINHTFSYQKELFPDLDYDQYLSLMAKLGFSFEN